MKDAAALTATLERIHIRNYTTVAFFVYLVLEYLQTFELEVKYVWPSKLNLVKVLFFGARYLGFINIPLLFVVEFGPHMRPRYCKAIYAVILVLMGASTTCSDAIAYIRVYALANRSRAMSIFLPVYFGLIYLAFYIVFIVDITKKYFGPSPDPSRYPCVLIMQDRLTMFIPFVLLLVSMMSVCILGLFFAMRNFHNTRSPLLRVFYVDGTLSFVLMAAVTVGKVVAHLVGPSEYLILLTAVHQAVHSTLSARMFLHMRARAHKGEDDTLGFGGRTAIFFAPFPYTLERQLEDRTVNELPTELTILSR